MAIKKRTITLTTGAGGTASGSLGLGAAYAKLLRAEFKGDDANVDTNNTFALTDADGRIVLTAYAADAGTDDSSAKNTEQSYSTVGLGFNLIYDEAKNLMSSGAVGTDNVGGTPIIARSPLTVAIASGTSGDVHRIHVFVEV